MVTIARTAAKALAWDPFFYGYFTQYPSPEAVFHRIPSILDYLTPYPSSDNSASAKYNKIIVFKSEPPSPPSFSRQAPLLHYYRRDLHLVLVLVPDGADFEVTVIAAQQLHSSPGFVGLHEPNRIPVQNRMEMDTCLEILENLKNAALTLTAGHST
jgi:hypothetical protein